MSLPYVELDSPISQDALVCRGCLTNSGEMKNINDWNFNDMFFKCTGIQVTRDDEFSELICLLCEHTMNMCHDFRIQCQKSDMKLKTPDIPVETPKKFEKNELIYTMDDNRLTISVIAPDIKQKINLHCPYECNGQFTKKTDFLNHMIKNHKLDKKFNVTQKYFCHHDNCQYNMSSGKEKWFIARKFLNQHYQKVHDTKFYCEVCTLSFFKEKDYNRHLDTCQTGFLCHHCSAVYKTNDRLMVHVMRHHPIAYEQIKNEKRKLKSQADKGFKRNKIESQVHEYICDSPKRSFATQTLRPEANIKNDVTLAQWETKSDVYISKMDDNSTQTQNVFDQIMSLKAQGNEEEMIFCSETAALADIQTQTRPIAFGLSRSNKETITSETQSPDLSMKETQTCYCLSDAAPSTSGTIVLTTAETQTAEYRSLVKSDVMLSFSSAETQTCSDIDEDNIDD